MSASLRFALILLVTSLLAGAAALVLSERERERRIQAFAEEATGGDAAQGEVLFERFGCDSCHALGSLAGRAGHAGPSLAGFAQQALIAGRLSNEPASLIRWLREPQAIEPGTGMPNLGLIDQEARDIAAHLYEMQ